MVSQLQSFPFRSLKVVTLSHRIKILRIVVLLLYGSISSFWTFLHSRMLPGLQIDEDFSKLRDKYLGNFSLIVSTMSWYFDLSGLLSPDLVGSQWKRITNTFGNNRGFIGWKDEFEHLSHAEYWEITKFTHYNMRQFLMSSIFETSRVVLRISPLCWLLRIIQTRGNLSDLAP